MASTKLAKAAVLLAAAAAVLSGCTETNTSQPVAQAQAPAATAMRTGSPSDERACEAATRKQTNNPQVVILSSDMSQANTEVILGVGPQRAKWRCLVSNGKVAEVTSLTDEGAL